MIEKLYFTLVEVPGVARLIFFLILKKIKKLSVGFLNNFRPFGPAVWPAVANIVQTNIYERKELLLLYYQTQFAL